MIGRTNAISGSGSFAGSNDAVVKVLAASGATVKLTRGTTTLTGSYWPLSSDASSIVHLIAVPRSLFNSSSAWTVTATKGSGSNTSTVTVDTNRVYEVDLRARIPMEYQEVAYLQSSGQQYINAGMGANTIGRGYFKGFMLTATANMSLFGASGSTSSIETQALAYRPQDGHFYLDDNGYMQAAATGSNRSFTVDFTVSNTALSVTVNGTTNSISGTVGTITSVWFWIFACSYQGQNLGGISARITEAKLWNRSNSLIADFVPCYRKSDNVAGFYDLVRQRFFTNGGSGSFTVGGNV